MLPMLYFCEVKTILSPPPSPPLLLKLLTLLLWKAVIVEIILDWFLRWSPYFEMKLLASSFKNQILSYFSFFSSFGHSPTLPPNPSQLERWQFENSSEWGKREIPDAEKQSLEEERRRLKLQVKEIQELLEMKNKAVPIKLSCDHQNAQSNLLVKNKVRTLLCFITLGAFPCRIAIS